MKSSPLLIAPALMLFLLGLGCRPAVAPSVPSMDVSDDQDYQYRISRNFPTEGVTKVVFRSASNQVELQPFDELGSKGSTMEVMGQAHLTYLHQLDATVDPISSMSRNLDFVAMKYGYTLVISTKNEIQDDKQKSSFVAFEMRLPKGVQLILERRSPTKHGKPDLSQPKI